MDYLLADSASSTLALLLLLSPPSLLSVSVGFGFVGASSNLFSAMLAILSWLLVPLLLTRLFW